MEYVPPLDGSGNDSYDDGDLAMSDLGSVIPAAALENPQREVVNAVSRSGQTPAGGDLTQLAKAIAGFEKALTDGATIAWDLNVAPHAVVTLGGNRTLGAPTNIQNGAEYRLVVKQDATGGRTLGYASAYAFPAASAPTITSTALRADVLVFVAHSGKMLLTRIAQNFTL